MNARLRWRKFVSGFMLAMTGVCALVSVSVLFLILGYLVFHGGTSISWNFFTKLPAPVGETGGGMANAIVGSGKLLLIAYAHRRSHRFSSAPSILPNSAAAPPPS